MLDVMLCTVVNQTGNPVTSPSLKIRPVFYRVWPSHASSISFLPEFDGVKHEFVNYDWDMGHKVNVVRNVTLSRFLELGHRSSLGRIRIALFRLTLLRP